MSTRNPRLFALPEPPPLQLTVAEEPWRLVRVFKHDFFAATALYASPADPTRRIVVKFGRSHSFLGLPLAWLGRWMRHREQRLHERLDGIEGIQRWLAPVGAGAYALHYVEGVTLDHLEAPLPPGFFDRLRELIDAVHARRAAYCDLNKRSNILLQPDGRPALIDFQISVAYDPAAAWPVRLWTRLWLGALQRHDLYHLYKHKRRLAPDALRDHERALLRRGPLLRLHRLLSTPFRRLRRQYLSRLHRKGELISPSAHLEDHHQPEKATWRITDP